MEHRPSTGYTAGEVGAKGVAIALNAVPIVGGVLSDIVNEVIAHRQSRRMDQFLLTLAEDLREVGHRMNREFVKTEDFQNLAEHILSKAAETLQQEKLDALRAVFLNTVLSARPKYDEIAETIDLITKWQARHIILVKILADPRQADAAMNHVVGSGGGFATSISQILHRLLPEWDDDQIDRTWQDLYDAHIHRSGGTKVMITDRGITQLENRLTDFGLKVSAFIQLPR